MYSLLFNAEEVIIKLKLNILQNLLQDVVNPQKIAPFDVQSMTVEEMNDMGMEVISTLDLETTSDG